MPEPSASAPPDVGELILKQTLMSAERTWLTWWRTALVATAGALAVGRVTPQALHVAAWPYVLLGLGYGVLAVGMIIVGAQRHGRLARAAVAGLDGGLDSRVVAAFTVGGIALVLCTVALILAQS
jgi:putative membrane protein